MQQFAHRSLLGLRHILTEESSLVEAFSRHWVEKPLTLSLLIALASIFALFFMLCCCCCVLQPCVVGLLRFCGLRERPFEKLEENDTDGVYRFRPTLWWRSPEQHEKSRRQWVMYFYKIGDRQSARKLGWDGVADPEAANYSDKVSFYTY
ncbi:hypothetical protein T492DRAFT_385351 [Pavlovales sp. CCMP2436]|nr:hypothetical protein T492DRAFT_385351 [Pavlovales sp. CCMP2436]